MFRRHPKHQNIGHADAGMGWRCGDVSSNCRSGIPHPIPSHPICPNPTQTHAHPPICCPVFIHTGTFAQSILSYQLKRHTIKRSGAGAEVIFTWLHKISSEDSIMSYQGIQSPSKCPPTAKASSTSNSYGDRWDRVDQEEVLLNDIEAATKRIFNQSKGLNEESKAHVRLLNKVENDMTLASLALRAETVHAEKMRQAKSGVCWMYGVIIIEIVSLLFLVYIGLSNS